MHQLSHAADIGKNKKPKTKLSSILITTKTKIRARGYKTGECSPTFIPIEANDKTFLEIMSASLHS